MHKSRLAGFIIDCDTDDLAPGAGFWSRALGAPAKPAAEQPDNLYVELQMPAGEPYVELQKVDHPDRVHLDIETDDVDAEVDRLVALGAKRIAAIKSWVVLEAPTGHRFCVVPVVSKDFDTKAHVWNEDER